MASGKMDIKTASAFVIANMIGTGVFTSLGFQLLTTTHPISIAILWLIGGLIAFCGAVAYGELGSVMPRSGGEYNYLSQIYHPSVGFIAGWTSLFVGFAAPVALATMAMSSYVSDVFPCINPQVFAVVVLTTITLFHSIEVGFSGKMQNVLTILKLLLIIVFVVAGLFAPSAGAANFTAMDGFQPSELLSPAFAVSLIWVYYAYSGWNAAAYISNDIENPRRNVPLALTISTVVVIVLYLLLNMVFLKSTPVDEMTGQIQVGLISAKHIFGERGGMIMGMLIALMLASSISSMVFVGPRVGMTMGEDHSFLRFLTKKNKKEIPYVAIWVQWMVSVVMILTDSFQVITQYTGIVISFCALMTVVGVAVHRYRFPNAERSYKTWAYPVPIVIFAVITVWSIVYMCYSEYQQVKSGALSWPWTTILSAVTVLSGLLFYWIDEKFSNKQIEK